MRSSALARNRRVYHACEASTRRTFSTVPTRPSQFATTCRRCAQQAIHAPPQILSQQRWQSQSSPASTKISEAPITSRAPPRTHYDLFPQTLPQGPPPSGPFIIDVRALRKEFLQLQAVAHPDRHPQDLKTRAEATSALINEAYKTLQNPLLRAQYLLRLRGIDVAEDETAKLDDEALLMEVLEAREEIEEAGSEEELEPLKRRNEERIRESEAVLSEAFSDEVEGHEDGLRRAKEEAVRLRYWVNIRESIDAWEKGKPVVLVH